MDTKNPTSAYTVKSGSFEGPLEVLLSLIESRKLFVNEISLAEVTNDYIAYIRTLSDIPNDKHIADVSYFVFIASTLILIKSKSLLPNLALTEEEEEKITNLEHRLKLYQIIKNASIDVKTTFGTQIIFTPGERIWSEPLFSPDVAIDSSQMNLCILDVLTHIPQKVEELPEVKIEKVINIDEMISSLTDRIQTAMNISFKEFAHSHNANTQAQVKIHVIVSFLAMLELVREGLIDVIQKNSFGDMEISKQDSPRSDLGTNF